MAAKLSKRIQKSKLIVAKFSTIHYLCHKISIGCNVTKKIRKMGRTITVTTIFYLKNIYVLYSEVKIFGSNFVLPVQTVILAYYLLFINVLSFVLYGVDKRRAVRNEYRIREGVLLWLARLDGGIYFIQAIYSDGNTATQKLVVTH